MNTLDAFRATTSRRARGFAAWTPQPDTLRLLKLVQLILDEYATFLPLTIRQVFYRLVGAHGYPKDELAYCRLAEHLNRARRAKLIPFEALRDDGFTRSGFLGYSGRKQFVDTLRRDAERFTLDRQRGQPQRLFIWCEAQGMVPQLQRVAHRFGIEVLSSGGFDSTSAKHQLAREFAALDLPVCVLHFGDHDASGVHCFLSLADDIEGFTQAYDGRGVEFERVLVLPAHIEEFRLPTAPPKPTDRRHFHGETVQAEALPPDVLAELVQQAIENRLNQTTYQRVLREEARQRATLVNDFARFGSRP